MASQSRLTYNNQYGQLGATMWGDSLEIVFGEIPDFGTLSGNDYIPLIIDPGQPNQEIVYLTAYTAGSNTGTILRAQDGGGGLANTDFYNRGAGADYIPSGVHQNQATWIQAPTAADFQKTSYSVYHDSSSLTIAGGSTWSVLGYNVLDYSTGGPFGIAAYLGAAFIPLTGGWYQIDARMLLDSLLVRNIISIWKNGSEAVRGTDTLGDYNPEMYTVSGIVYFDGAGDYFEIEGYSDGTGPVTVNTTTIARTRMTATLVCPG